MTNESIHSNINTINQLLICQSNITHLQSSINLNESAINQTLIPQSTADLTIKHQSIAHQYLL